MYFKLSKEVRDALVEYLASRPYKEVARGIQALTELTEVMPNETEKTNQTN